ncbi:MAG: VWA domain-containing protein [Deltaproteobacteria bacterium]|nr:VWA domain-containing protein [Deltaproteobacteria bacterium]
MNARLSLRACLLSLLLPVSGGVLHSACSAGDGASSKGGTGAGGTGGSSSGDGGALIGGFTGNGGGGGMGGDCGYAEYSTTLEPGVLLLVYDQSCSMVECPDGSTTECNTCPTPSKWALAEQAMNTVLATLPDELRMGLILYPNGVGLGCQVDSAPHVAVDSLSATRQPILNELNITPGGGGTPTLYALQLAYQTLGQINDNGKKAALLVTDGAWNCPPDPFNPMALNDLIFNEATLAHDQFGFDTYVVGIQEPSAYLSHLAHVGGTERLPTCNPDYATIQNPFIPTCEDSQGTCCNYTVGQDVVTELSAALQEIASQLMDTCVFAVPKGDDPNMFDPNMVNVYVDGELVYPDPNEGWSYVGGDTDYIEIHGALCDALLSGDAEEVIIQLGCPTAPPR